MECDASVHENDVKKLQKIHESHEDCILRGLKGYWSNYILYVFYSSLVVAVIFQLFNSTVKIVSHFAVFAICLIIFLTSAQTYHYNYYFTHVHFFPVIGISIGLIASQHFEPRLKKNSLITGLFFAPLVIFGYYSQLIFLTFFIV